MAITYRRLSAVDRFNYHARLFNYHAQLRINLRVSRLLLFTVANISQIYFIISPKTIIIYIVYSSVCAKILNYRVDIEN